MEDEVVDLSSNVAPEAGQEAEKLLPVSRVNEIVKREKSLAAEKVRKELEAKYAQDVLQSKQQHPQESLDSIEERVVQRLLAESKKQDEMYAKQQQEQEEARQLEEMKQVANRYHSKMSLGKDLFNDFEEVMGDFEPAAFPQIVFLAADMDNTAALMYELSKNPQKLASLHTLSMSHPKLAKKELEKLSASISQNQQALENNVSTQAPLSRLKSSTNTGVDSGNMSIRDFKNATWLRPTR